MYHADFKIIFNTIKFKGFIYTCSGSAVAAKPRIAT